MSRITSVKNELTLHGLLELRTWVRSSYVLHLSKESQNKKKKKEKKEGFLLIG